MAFASGAAVVSPLLSVTLMSEPAGPSRTDEAALPPVLYSAPAELVAFDPFPRRSIVPAPPITNRPTAAPAISAGLIFLSFFSPGGDLLGVFSTAFATAAGAAVSTTRRRLSSPSAGSAGFSGTGSGAILLPAPAS